MLTPAFSWLRGVASPLPLSSARRHPLPGTNWGKLLVLILGRGDGGWLVTGARLCFFFLSLPTRISSYFWIWLFCRSLAVGSKSGYKFFSLSSVDKLEQIYECSKCLLYFSPSYNRQVMLEWGCVLNCRRDDCTPNTPWPVIFSHLSLSGRWWSAVCMFPQVFFCAIADLEVYT